MLRAVGCPGQAAGNTQACCSRLSQRLCWGLGCGKEMVLSCLWVSLFLNRDTSRDSEFGALPPSPWAVVSKLPDLTSRPIFWSSHLLMELRVDVCALLNQMGSEVGQERS